MIPADQVSDLVPFVHVTDVDRSVAFYERLGFEMRHEFVPEDRRVWAFLERGDARLMVAGADGAFDPDAQGILFYAYTRDLDGLRARLLDGGVAVGEITTGGPGPDRQLEVTDPDGYVLMLAEIAGERVGVLPDPAPGKE
jgi:catechol 2,3-dioxygenase-like lactoylglutathione lyase family enzyme